MRNPNMEDGYNVITLAALLMAVDEKLTQLNGTTACKHDIKFTAKKLRSLLDREMPAIQNMFDMEPGVMNELYLRASNFVPAVFKLTPNQWQIVAESANVAANPDWLKHRQLLAVLTQPDK